MVARSSCVREVSIVHFCPDFFFFLMTNAKNDPEVESKGLTSFSPGCLCQTAVIHCQFVSECWERAYFFSFPPPPVVCFWWFTWCFRLAIDFSESLQPSPVCAFAWVPADSCSGSCANRHSGIAI